MDFNEMLLINNKKRWAFVPSGVLNSGVAVAGQFQNKPRGMPWTFYVLASWDQQKSIDWYGGKIETENPHI